MLTSDIESEVEAQLMNSPLLKELASGSLLSFGVAGLNEEAGEVAGLLCREVYKGKLQDPDRWLEELGDVLWYLVLVCLVRHTTIAEVFEYNKLKLEARYGRHG